MVQRQQQPRRESEGGWQPPPREKLERILSQDDYGEELVAVAKEVGQRLAQRLKAAQARKFYSEIRRIATDVQYRQGEADKARPLRS